METVNSLSGGKTSSYLAIHHPADHELFALVCNDDPKCAHPDKKIMQRANDKLSKYTPHMGEFIGTPEHISIIQIMFDLEQVLGREIKWLRGRSFDDLIKWKSAVPNQNARWCTTFMKLDPIFWYCYLHTEFPVDMRIGFRYDELERADRLTTEYKIPNDCNNFGEHRQNWKTFVDWRIGSFPLIDDKITNYQVSQFWKDKGFTFPEDSNCQNCFWKHEQQLRKNFDSAPNVMQWAKEKEQDTGTRLRHKMTLERIEKIGLQQEFSFGGGSGCQADGFCTD